MMSQDDEREVAAQTTEDSPAEHLHREIEEDAGGRIIAIANQKGGVGKTTTAINLSACLGSAGVPVLVIDCDPQFNASSGLGCREIREKKNIYRALIDNGDIHDNIVHTPYENLDLIPATPDLSGAEIEFQGSDVKFSILKEKIAPLTLKYRFIFIDCPPSLGLLTINALSAAHSIFIPIQCEYYALEGLTLLLRTIDLVKKRLNISLETEGILLTMCDTRTNLANQVVREVRDYFKDMVFKNAIPRNVRLAEAPGFGKPIIYYDAHCTGAISYTRLADEILANYSIARAAPAPVSSAASTV